MLSILSSQIGPYQSPRLFFPLDSILRLFSLAPSHRPPRTHLNTPLTTLLPLGVLAAPHPAPFHMPSCCFSLLPLQTSASCSGVHHSAAPQDHHRMWHKMLRLGSHTDLDFRPVSGSPQLCDLRTVEPISTTVKQNTKGQLRGCWGQEARHGMFKCFIHSDPASHSLLTGR